MDTTLFKSFTDTITWIAKLLVEESRYYYTKENIVDYLDTCMELFKKVQSNEPNSLNIIPHDIAIRLVSNTISDLFPYDDIEASTINLIKSTVEKAMVEYYNSSPEGETEVNAKPVLNITVSDNK